MAYKTIIPATDWFYVHSSGRTGEADTVQHIAAFGLTDTEAVVALVPVRGRLNAGNPTSPRLIAVSNEIPEARILHRDQLNSEQLNGAKIR